VVTFENFLAQGKEPKKWSGRSWFPIFANL